MKSFNYPSPVMGLLGRVIVGLLPFAPKFIVSWVAKRYIAGENLEQALSAMRRISVEGSCFTIDVLGEEVRTMDETNFFVNEYALLLDAISSEGLDANISVKPTAFGLLIDRKKALDRIESLVRNAQGLGIFVCLDMEDSRITDATLEVLFTMHDRGLSNVGVAIQGRLHRTIADIGEITSRLGSNSDIRVCKGIYLEPDSIAYTSYSEIVEATSEAVNEAISKGAYVAIASHDGPVIDNALRTLDKFGMGPGKGDSRPLKPQKRKSKGEGYEFQFLLGVKGDIRRRLTSQGHRTRVYLPYGTRWYEYSMRRLRENPEVAWHVTKALLLPWTNRR